MAVFVLIHGGWYGGWCWHSVASKLSAMGHRVYCPTLTGVGERVHLLNEHVNLSTHITDITNLLFYEDLYNIILCGHSYGGMVITGVANIMPERIGTIVYLDAFLPENGKAVYDYLSPERQKRFLNLAEKYGEGKYIMPIPPENQKNPRGDHAELAWRFKRATPHPIACICEPIQLRAPENNTPDHGSHLFGGIGVHRIKTRVFLHCLQNTPSAFQRIYQKLDGNLWHKYALNERHNFIMDNVPEAVKILSATSQMESEPFSEIEP